MRKRFDIFVLIWQIRLMAIFKIQTDSGQNRQSIGLQVVPLVSGRAKIQADLTPKPL